MQRQEKIRIENAAMKNLLGRLDIETSTTFSKPLLRFIKKYMAIKSPFI